MNSGPFSGMDCEAAIKAMSAHAEKNGFGKATVTYRLKDWGISRQRYWGTPIPMLYCEKDGIVSVPEKDLPVILPENVDITLTGGSPLGRVPQFVNATDISQPPGVTICRNGETAAIAQMAATSSGARSHAWPRKRTARPQFEAVLAFAAGERKEFRWHRGRSRRPCVVCPNRVC